MTFQAAGSAWKAVAFSGLSGPRAGRRLRRPWLCGLALEGFKPLFQRMFLTLGLANVPRGQIPVTCPRLLRLLRPSINGSRLQFITLHVVFSFVPGGHARPTPTAESGFRPSQLVVLCGEVLGASAGVLFLV